MEGRGRRALQAHHSSLVKVIKASWILDLLFEKNRISRRTFNEILEWKEEQDRARKILMVVTQSITFQEFLGLLNATGTDGQTINNLRHSTLTNEDAESSETDSDDLQNNSHMTVTQDIGQLVMQNVKLKNSQMSFNSIIRPYSDQGTPAPPVPGVRSQERRVGGLEQLPTAVAPCGWPTPASGRPELQRREIFNTMLNTMLHDPDCKGSAKYPCVTYGFFTVDGVTVSEVLDRDDTLHWEEKAIAALTSSIESGKLRGTEGHRVVFYTNWSPCPLCVQGLLRFLQWSKGEGVVISLSIKVAALFHITWPECQAQSCDHLRFALHDDAYLQGVRQLFQHGVAVEAFAEDDWRSLWRALGLPDTAVHYSSARQRTDYMLQLSLRAIRESAW